MKILRIKFDNVLIFKDSFDFRFDVTDRILLEEEVYRIHKSIATQNVISIVGVNAVGKTTTLKLINMALEIVINNKGLNESGVIPAIIFNREVLNSGLKLTVDFFNDNRFYQLESIIKIRENSSGNIYFYYEDEVLKSKPKSNVNSREVLYRYDEMLDNISVIKRNQLTTEQLSILKDDDTISILGNKKNDEYDANILTIFNDQIDSIEKYKEHNSMPILKVFDSNIKTFEHDGDRINLQFENNNININSNSPLAFKEFLSSGTLKGEKIVRNAINIFKTGGYLIIDELENHLNKELVEVIISMFNNEEINKKGACLVFSTHYAETLDSFNRSDNIYVLRRDANNLTEMKRYSEYISRNDLKKSDVLFSNYIKGTAPNAFTIQELEEYICQQI